MYADIRAALEARLATVSGLPDADHRAVENTRYEPRVGETWLRHRLAPADERLLTMPAQGGWKQVDGAWRLLLHFPLDTGTTAGDTLSAAIVLAFPPGLTLTSGAVTVRIDSSRRWSGGRDIEEGWYTIPIDVRWHVWATNTLN